MWAAIWDCNRDAGNRDRASRRCTSAKKAIPILRTLLVQGAQHILGPFGVDCDLRRWALKLAARGGRSGKKRAIVATAEKVGGVAASPVGERRSIRTPAQQQPSRCCGGRLKDKTEIVPGREKTKAKAEFR